MRNLKHQAISGVRWTGLSTGITTGLQFIQVAVLARLLRPEDFGLMAMVMVVIGFAQVISEAGLSEAIIQRKEPKRTELSSLYWFNIMIGLIIFLSLWIVTPWIAIAFDAEELNVLLPVIGITFLIAPLGVQFQALIQKKLCFNLLAGVEVITSSVSLLIAVLSAWWWNQGVWSLVWGYLGGITARTTVLLCYGWSSSILPQLHLRLKDLAGYLRFGFYRVGAMGINYLNSRVDQLLIGVLLGPQALGYYSIAVSLVLQPIQNLNPVLTRVAFPVFSQIEDDMSRLKMGYLEMIRIIMFVNAPALVGIAVVAPVAVPLLLGERWYPTIPLVQVLAIYALVRSLGNAGGSLILARGHADWTFYWNSALLLVIPPVLYVASLSGQVVYIAWSLVGLQMILFLIHYRVLIRNLIGPCFKLYIFAIGTPTIFAIVMSVVLLSIEPFVVGLPRVAHLTAQIVIGFVSYLTLMYVFKRSQLLSTFDLLLGRI